MLTNARLSYLWCILTGAILFMSILPDNSWSYKIVAIYDSSRWGHFLLYALLAAIPVAAWRRKASMLICLAIAGLMTAFEFLRADIPGLIDRPQNGLAATFGIGAGILLGLNLRNMHNSSKSANQLSPSSSR